MGDHLGVDLILLMVQEVFSKKAAALKKPKESLN